VYPVTAEDTAAETIAEATKRALQDLVEAERVEWFWGDVADGEQIEMNVEVYSPGDLLDAYERIVCAPDRAWSHGENSHGFLESRWEQPLAEQVLFLTPGIESATVICKRWTSPERLHRRS
jgi:hypothetical protein